jgi:photosystem II stability/assembly factor-like uncharacterized protein
VTVRKLALIGIALALGATATPPLSPTAGKTKGAEVFKTPEQLLLEHYYEEAIEEAKAPEDAYLFGKIFTGDTASLSAFRTATSDARKTAARTAARSPKLARKRWKFVGPATVGARVVDVTVDPKLKDTVYLAAASGGVWKSTDKATTFKPIWKSSATQSMGALAQGKDATLWAGTGEANPGGGSLTYGGTGVYKSTNRGRSWKNVGLKNTSRIGRIVVDPKDPKHVLVAATGSLFEPGGARGLYETRNAGKSWKLILEGKNETTGAVDVAIDPKNPKNIFVAMWDHLRFPDYRRYTGPGSGLWRSTNGGKDFVELGVEPGVGIGLPPGNDITGGRIGVAIDPKNPDRVWAIYANNNEGAYAGFFRSTDGGDTWSAPPQAAAGLAAGHSVYGWWFGRLFVDPYNTDHLFATGLPLMQSLDGGSTFATSSGMHVDQHGVAWDPHKKGRVYAGNDGGIYRSETNGSSGSWIHGKYQPWSQFFTIDVSEQDPTWINGGLQDNGSVRSWGLNGWHEYLGGDGVKNAINPKDKMNVFACSQYGACAKSDNGGNSMAIFDNDVAASSRKGWLTPIEFAPHDSNVVYYAGSNVHRSPDKGDTWELISPDLGEGDAGRETNPLYAAHYGTVQALGLNKKNPDVIYAGTDNAKLWKTTDGGTLWSKIEDDKLPNRWITHIAVKLDNPNVLYVSYSGYRSSDNSAYVFKSKNGGKDWTNISKTLPKAPVNDLVLVGKKLYAATDVGVFVMKTTGGPWLKVGRGLPLCPVNDLRYVPKNKSLYAGTFGRGIYVVKPPRRF